MSSFGTDIYAAQRIVQFRTDDRICEAERARTARASRRIKVQPPGASQRPVRRSFGFGWTFRRDGVRP
jgi:hypothetical protein